MTRKPREGRFTEETSKLLEQFSQSVSFDKRLYLQDIRGSIAHARMLGKKEIIGKEDARTIIQGLQKVQADIESGKLQWDQSLEDVHMNIEAALTDETGDAGARLHTARSRNDQVATDLKLYLRDASGNMKNLLLGFMECILDKAQENLDTYMPGYTHLQRAQPVLLAHHLMAYFQMLKRDAVRFGSVMATLSESPLGSGALAGTPFPIDREMTAAELGFEGMTANSMDAVSDRDFAAEFLFACALCQVHLSRIAEDIILWASSEFDFIDLPDSLCTGSSMMPQKKNPDPAELVRGKTGRVTGNLVSLLVTLKGLPMTYNRDLQEDKEPVFDSADTLSGSLKIMSALVSGSSFKTGPMAEAAAGSFTTATDLADYLVLKGLPFRKAHEVTGSIVKHCIETGCGFDDITLEKMKTFAAQIEDDIFEAISVKSSVSKRSIPGGTAPERVKEAIGEARTYVEENRSG